MITFTKFNNTEFARINRQPDRYQCVEYITDAVGQGFGGNFAINIATLPMEVLITLFNYVREMELYKPSETYEGQAPGNSY